MKKTTQVLEKSALVKEAAAQERTQTFYEDRRKNIEQKTMEVAQEVCREHGLNAEDLIRAEGLPFEDHMHTLIIEALHKLALLKTIFESDDFIDELAQCKKFPELMAIRDVIFESQNLVHAANDIYYKFN